MFNTFIIPEVNTDGYTIETLDFITIAAILSSIFVIISKNPVKSVLFLITLFIAIASYLILLGLNFIGISYLLVYVGAVSILFLFILMLINVRISELLSNTNKSIPLSLLIIICFIIIIYPIFSYNTYDFIYSISSITDIINNKILDIYLNFINTMHNDLVYYVTSKVWDSNMSEASHITSIGNILYTSYSIWLVITSIILLLAMVGTIIISVKKS